MRLAGWNYGYGRTPLEDAVAHMAGVGYEGMELATGDGHSTPLATLDDGRVRAIAALTGRHGLPIVAVSALFNLVSGDEAAWRDEWARWRRAIEVAALLGRSEGVPTTPFVACGSGAAPAGFDRPRLWSALRDNTRRVVQYAAEQGVTLAIEPHWGASVERPGDAVELIEAIGSPNLRANCDVCHPFALGYDLESIARILGRHTVY